MAILATLPGLNLFSPPPSNPRIKLPNNSKQPPTPPIPIPKYPRPQKSRKPISQPQNFPSYPAFKTVHHQTKYYKPVSDGVIASEGDRSVMIGESGVSYLLPGAPFEFQYSYSETPKAKPLAIREPAFLPFAPPTMPRPWTGKAPLKKSKKNIPLFDSFSLPPPGMKGVKHVEIPGPFQFGKYPKHGKTREEILGEPLRKSEIRMLVKPHLSHNRQVNLGRDGLTHNMLELIHSHWKRQRVCKVKCRGVPTVDMENVCHHVEEKTGGKIIHRVGGVLYLFRGRNYNYRTRPQYPVMLWKPATPVYPKLIQEAPEGLTKFEADELRMKGKNLLPICKLAKNGAYINLVHDVRNAFEGSPMVKINCQGMHASDYKKLGAKLKLSEIFILIKNENLDDPSFLSTHGDGNTFSFWHDPWLNGGVLSMRIRSQDLNQIWREIRDSDKPDDACKDLIIWKPAKNGKFSTKSAWENLRSSNEVVPWFRTVWTEATMPRHSFILWMAIKNRLKIIDFLIQIEVLNVSYCSLCDAQEEIRAHLFFECPYSNYIWSQILLSLGIFKRVGKWEDELNWLMNARTIDSAIKLILIAAIAVTVYCIWGERNQRHFNNISSTKEAILGKIKNLVIKKIQATNIRFWGNHINQQALLNWGVNARIKQPRISGYDSWMHSTAHMVILNIASSVNIK
ncbi:hypothetical protein GIB67_024825 [Kingdonia uniflora]|uniref:CRM domain-containing protein n=1 Tax=Kingdonia uniflora TaxID=39325 RepID=A0A7J7NYQ3_9MAGN|nr:hypothetical protein GIB67_024825 [Kingdonia uniflora]